VGGNIAGAISTLRSITTKHPDKARALALLGDALFESGDATEAHAVYATHDDHTHTPTRDEALEASRFKFRDFGFLRSADIFP
jgi:thioredoxin-like negative regulator of GroEL